ncbi:hypothetical protein LWI28_013591 [Acer negundo]|uniref:Uncharacterized protein n=1 Tax=Acer negundo TaxID=4023 RepID=A0AAD5JD14_ACENE|nr:hypothetical protein LWI28_013591 [Acer negundo]
MFHAFYCFTCRRRKSPHIEKEGKLYLRSHNRNNMHKGCRDFKSCKPEIRRYEIQRHSGDTPELQARQEGRPLIAGGTGRHA